MLIPLAPSSTILACEKDGQLDKALLLLEQMHAAGIQPNLITYSASIVACEKDGQWEEALSLFKQMCAAGIQPDAIAYTAAIQACASAGQPAEALEIFDEAQRNVTADRFTLNAILDAVCTSHPAKAHALYSCGQCLYGTVESTKNGAPNLDLHEHSEGAGETAVRWWLGERVPAMTTEPEKLIIITGGGKSRSAIQSGDLHRRVERSLAKLNVPMMPVNNLGHLIVDAQAWLRTQNKKSRLGILEVKTFAEILRIVNPEENIV